MDINVKEYKQNLVGYLDKIKNKTEINQQYELSIQFLQKEELSENVLNGFQDSYSAIIDSTPLWSSSPIKNYELLSILLPQCIDSQWYDGWKTFYDFQEFKQTQEGMLCYLNPTTTVGSRLFHFIHLVEHWYTRIPNRLARYFRTWFNRPGKNTMGLIIPYCPSVIFIMINQICISIRDSLGREVVVHVNDIFRTRAHQNHLVSLGYIAPSNSAHLSGYAVDIEQSWLAENDPEGWQTLVALLADWESKNWVNVIKYNTFWHICLNPAYHHLFNRVE